jgi:putative two-component system response regulator
MRIEKLLELEARIKRCVASDDREGFRETISHLCVLLQIPSVGDPARVERSEPTHALIKRCASLVMQAVDPAPESLCAEILICACARSMTLGDVDNSEKSIELAVTLARLGTHRATLRRALNVSSVGAIATGNASLGLTRAMQSCAIAKELGDPLGTFSSLVNATSILMAIGDHRYVAALGQQILEYCEAWLPPETAKGMQVNMATCLLSLRDYKSSQQFAESACKNLASPKSPVDYWLRLVAEIVGLRCAIALNDVAIVEARMRFIELCADELESARTELMREHALSVYDSFKGRHESAIERLVSMHKNSKNVPSLHLDTLTLLFEAHEKKGDQIGALKCLAEQVEYRSRWQSKHVFEQLAQMKLEPSAATPAHDDAATLVKAIEKGSCTRPLDGEAVASAATQKVLERLAVAAELNEDDSGRHIYRVGRLTGLLAAEIGYDATAADAMDRAARLHDIGKLGLPGALVARAEALSAAEHKVMREHAGTGRKILQQANDPAFDLACDIAQSHHERWDGRGYPQKLKHAAIPESARMVALTEAFDVLTHGRAYQPAVPVAAALLRLQQASGTHFEPRLVDALLKVVARLQQAHGGDDAALSDYLGDAGTASSFLQARDSMQDLVSALSPAR